MALILAFIFRAFVVEAFVIPTGSMASTLLGAHMRFVCPDCGHLFHTTYPSGSSASQLNIPSRSGPVPVRVNALDEQGNRTFLTEYHDRDYAITCENCAYQIPPNSNDSDKSASSSGVYSHASEGTSRNPPVHYGDRILVLKYPYLIAKPKRWDVVVFKDPSDQPNYNQNFIKRLVGLPGESVLILEGDVYTAQANSNIFRIARKPIALQNHLWRVVYDNDKPPKGLSRTHQSSSARPFQQPWVSTSPHWTIPQGQPWARTISFDHPSESATLTFSPNEAARNHPMTDFLAYNATENQGPGSPPDTTDAVYDLPLNNVTDVKLQFLYQRRSGSGPLMARIEREGTTFTLHVDGQFLRLFMTPPAAQNHPENQPVQIGQPVPIPPSGPMLLALAQADYRVWVELNGQPILQTSDEDYKPNADLLITRFSSDFVPSPASISITASEQNATISHLSVSRDIYYTNTSSRGYLRWASPISFPERVVSLGDQEYFVLGDNSQLSADSRFWPSNISLPYEDLFVEPGRVPGRFLLGKAFFVYWPSGYRPFDSAPPLVPDFSRMRLIR